MAELDVMHKVAKLADEYAHLLTTEDEKFILKMVHYDDENDLTHADEARVNEIYDKVAG